MLRLIGCLLIVFLSVASSPQAQVTRYVYVTPVDGAGTDADPYHSRCWTMPNMGNVDLRPWGINRFLCASDTLPADTTGILQLGTSLKGTLSGGTKTALVALAGKAIAAGTIDEAIIELLQSKLRAGRDGKIKIWLGDQLPMYQQTAWVPFRDNGLVADVWNALQPAVAWATTLATETFTGADGDLTGRTFVHPWTEFVSTGCTIVSNQVSASSDCNARADADLATDDMEVSVVMVSQALGGSTSISCGPIARKDSTATETFYYMFATTSTGPAEDTSLSKRLAGTPTSLDTDTGDFADGDTLKILPDGSTISGYNGVNVVLGPVTDVSITGNTRGGVRVSKGSGGTPSCVLDTWNASDYTAPASSGATRRRVS